MPSSIDSSDRALHRLQRLLLYEKREEVAKRLDVGVALLNAWVAPARSRTIASENWPKIDAAFVADSQVWEPGDFEYVGTRWNDDSFSVRQDASAMEAIERALDDSTLRLFAPNGPSTLGMDFDLFIRSAPLREGVFAHLLATDQTLYAVVVNGLLEPEVRLDAAWAEYFTHIAGANPDGRPVVPDTVGSPPDKMSRLIRECRRMSQKDLANKMSSRLSKSGQGESVREDEIQDWEHGRTVPRGAKQDVLQRLFTECHRFWPVTRFQNICTLADEDCLPEAQEATDAMKKLLQAGPGFAPAPAGKLTIDIHVRSAKLGVDALAHRFRGAPGVHVILVSAGTANSPEFQLDIASREVREVLSGDSSASDVVLIPPAGSRHYAHHRGAEVSTPVGQAAPRKKDSSRYGAWVASRSLIAKEPKRLLAAYAVKTWITFASMVQLGSGTTLNEVMHNIIATQRRDHARWDLTILTTNLDILEYGRDARAEDIRLFGGMQIQLTGGALQPSLDSLIGEYAAHGVSTKLMTPTLVFFGVAGLTFRGSELKITYQYDDELSTQISYAKRETTHRVILCDHTKLGSSAGFDARLSFEDLLSNAETCTIVTDYPEGDDAAIDRLDREVESFKEILRGIVAQKRFMDKDLSLRLVKKEGEELIGDGSLVANYSLSALYEGQRSEPLPEADAPRG